MDDVYNKIKKDKTQYTLNNLDEIKISMKFFKDGYPIYSLTSEDQHGNLLGNAQGYYLDSCKISFRKFDDIDIDMLEMYNALNKVRKCYSNFTESKIVIIDKVITQRSVRGQGLAKLMIKYLMNHFQEKFPSCFFILQAIPLDCTSSQQKKNKVKLTKLYNELCFKNFIFQDYVDFMYYHNLEGTFTDKYVPYKESNYIF